MADPSVELVRVVGTGYGTPTSVQRYNHCDFIFFSFKVDHKLVEADTGDGTVPQGSAVPGKIYDPRGRTSTEYVTGLEHGELAKDPDVLAQAIKYFRPETQQSSTESLRVTGTDEETKFVDAPQPVNGIELESEGPARGYVSDGTGNILGSYPEQPEKVTFQRIPGGSYNSTSAYQSFFLNEDDSYKGELEVTGGGSVQLGVRTYVENRTDGLAVFRVNAPVGAKLQMDFATSQDPGDLKLQIDRDGDGTVDREVAPSSIAVGQVAEEADPPNTTATFDSAPNGRVSVTLSAKDGPKGSGAADTYYMLEGDTKSRLYKSPFTVPSGTPVRFLSVDKAGNTELIKKVVVRDGH